MMYITKVRLKNVRCFEDAEIDFGKPGSSLVICGDNGSGKTSVLRSIALGLCDHISAGALLRDLPGDFIRKAPDSSRADRNAVIAIDLVSESGKDKCRITTTLKTRPDVGFEWVETGTTKNGTRLKEYQFPWQNIFVTAYGAGLRTNGSKDYVQYLAPDAVYSLFDYSYPLHNPELAWRRLVEVGKNKKQIERLIIDTLKDILSLDKKESEISLEENGIFIESSWGKQELDALGDGYRALVTLTLDILAWQLLAKNHELIIETYESKRKLKGSKQTWKAITDFKTLRGIVIIDEIEKHLHPNLQMRVLKTLRTHFTKMQFIVTTHSPLVISSMGDVPTVFLEEGRIGEKKHLDGWLAENIYLQMGTGGSRSEEYRKLISDYEKFFAKKLKKPLQGKDLQEFNSLRAKLKALPGTDLSLLDIETRHLSKQRG